MNIRLVLVFVFFGVLLIDGSNGLFIKAKILAVKKPILLAKAAVLKDVKVKAATAAAASATALQATGSAIKSAMLAPFTMASRAVGAKLDALRAIKAVKVATAANLLQAASGIGANQLVLPQGPVAVLPLNSLHVSHSGNIVKFPEEAVRKTVQYRFIPELGFRHYNQIDFTPSVKYEVHQQPTVQIQQPHTSYGLPAV